jgi:hypothetical protein
VRVVSAIVRASKRAAVAITALLATTSARAEPPTGHPEPSAAAPPSELDQLRAELDAERKARQALEARVDRQESAAATEGRQGEPGQVPLAGIQVSGYVHFDWILFRQSSQDELKQDGQPLNEDRFVLRRARLRAERDYGLFHGAVEIDANTISGLQVRPMNAEASFKWPARRPYPRTYWAVDPSAKRVGAEPRAAAEAAPPPPTSEPWFMVTAGLFRTPFGFEVAESERDRPWLERSTMSNALFPLSFDLGLRIAGGFGFVRYAFAVMNGDPIGERTFPGRDPSKSKDLVFRVGGASAVTDAIQIEGGVSAVTGRGFHQGQPASKDVLQWQDSNADGVVDQITEVTVIPGSPATPSQPFKRFAVGADLRLTIRLPTLGDLHLRGEVVRASNLDRGLYVSDPIVSTRDLRQLGYYVGASQEITRWALVGVRYDRYDPDADAREQEPFVLVPRDSSMSTWSFSAAGRTRVARLVAQYDHRTNAFGRDASGRPTTLADDSFTLRAEVRF